MIHRLYFGDHRGSLIHQIAALPSKNQNYHIREDVAGNHPAQYRQPDVTVAAFLTPLGRHLCGPLHRPLCHRQIMCYL